MKNITLGLKIMALTLAVVFSSMNTARADCSNGVISFDGYYTAVAGTEAECLAEVNDYTGACQYLATRGNGKCDEFCASQFSETQCQASSAVIYTASGTSTLPSEVPTLGLWEAVADVHCTVMCICSEPL